MCWTSWFSLTMEPVIINSKEFCVFLDAGFSLN